MYAPNGGGGGVTRASETAGLDLYIISSYSRGTEGKELLFALFLSFFHFPILEPIITFQLINVTKVDFLFE